MHALVLIAKVSGVGVRWSLPKKELADAYLRQLLVQSAPVSSMTFSSSLTSASSSAPSSAFSRPSLERSMARWVLRTHAGACKCKCCIESTTIGRHLGQEQRTTRRPLACRKSFRTCQMPDQRSRGRRGPACLAAVPPPGPAQASSGRSRVRVRKSGTGAAFKVLHDALSPHNDCDTLHVDILITFPAHLAVPPADL